MTSAFVIQVHSDLQPDPNQETAALLRILIYTINNTALGDGVPPVPRWSGPPHTAVNVEAILYASLAASLFSAFLAMLGKQWLNRYESIDLRGSAIERSQNRQRKLDGIVTWYFDHVMELLPLMLQFALLLLGSALSIYLWGIDMTVASVVLSVTSFGVILYACIVVAGTASISCPYQTPGAQILRHILHHTLPLILAMFRSAFSSAIKNSKFIEVLISIQDHLKNFECSIADVIPLPTIPFALLMWLAWDAYLLARATAKVFAHRVHGWFRGARGLDP